MHRVLAYSENRPLDGTRDEIIYQPLLSHGCHRRHHAAGLGLGWIDRVVGASRDHPVGVPPDAAFPATPVAGPGSRLYSAPFPRSCLLRLSAGRMGVPARVA